jgi:hypothetical protein
VNRRKKERYGGREKGRTKNKRNENKNNDRKKESSLTL